MFKIKSDKPKLQILYAVTDGVHKGKTILFIEPNTHPRDNMYAAIAMNIHEKTDNGGFEILDLPEEAVKEGLKLKILDKIKRIPKGLYNMCCQEYYHKIKESVKNESTN